MSDEQAANSLKRGLAILQVFSEEQLEWTPEELMERLGYSRPTLYRYLKTLKEAGLLSSSPNAGFTLGPKVVEMDFLLRKSDALILNGQKHLENLTSRYSCTALLVRRYGFRILCVASEQSAQKPRTSYPRGRPMPLGRGAIARSMMAFLPRRRLLPLIEQTIGEFREIGLGNSVDEVLESLRRVRKAGFAVAFGEVTPGVVGIAAPVFDAGQSPVAAVCVTIAGHLVNGTIIDEIGREVRKAAGEITLALSEQRLGTAAQ
ncbi:IclR family transcriptional regulator [Chelativorans sp.]|uniref:IclR family transcriptional regulator n=1 Tax=Chelativorans sp. TaxID=2203393 RepID=UPI0028117BA8|nr:IclR family transcriptional regulator [Chelativorans sp.]